LPSALFRRTAERSFTGQRFRVWCGGRILIDRIVVAARYSNTLVIERSPPCNQGLRLILSARACARPL